MENEKNSSRKLMFLEPVNKDTDTERLLERLVLKLEGFGFNIVGRDEEKKKKVKWVELTEDDPIFRQGFIISNQSFGQGKNKRVISKTRKQDLKINHLSPSIVNKKRGT